MAALKRGELVRLVAEVEAGRMRSEDLQAAIDQCDSTHRILNFVRLILGK